MSRRISTKRRSLAACRHQKLVAALFFAPPKGGGNSSIVHWSSSSSSSELTQQTWTADRAPISRADRQSSQQSAVATFCSQADTEPRRSTVDERKIWVKLARICPAARSLEAAIRIFHALGLSILLFSFSLLLLILQQKQRQRQHASRASGGERIFNFIGQPNEGARGELFLAARTCSHHPRYLSNRNQNDNEETLIAEKRTDTEQTERELNAKKLRLPVMQMPAISVLSLSLSLTIVCLEARGLSVGCARLASRPQRGSSARLDGSRANDAQVHRQLHSFERDPPTSGAATAEPSGPTNERARLGTSKQWPAKKGDLIVCCPTSRETRGGFACYLSAVHAFFPHPTN